MAVSQRIQHEKFGLGVVAEADADYTVIEFDEHGRKKFLTRLVTVRASDEPPPTRRRASRKKTAKKKTSKTRTRVKGRA